MDANYSFSDFPCGLLITTVEERELVFANSYFYKMCARQTNEIDGINALFTPASRIIIESYVIPLLLKQKKCEEVQLTLHKTSGERLPVLINAQIRSQDRELIYWVITVAQQRDDLYQELVDLRNALESKAEKLEELSQTDELTGLLNRRAFFTKANEKIKQAERSELAYSFFMIDIDDFKDINDEHGHDVGDHVLEEIANLFSENCRENDVLARMGGEEFAVVTITESHESSHRLAEKLLNIIGSQKICDIDVTISIGFATSSQLSLEKLFKQADVLLYEAKDEGKNRIKGLNTNDEPT